MWLTLRLALRLLRISEPRLLFPMAWNLGLRSVLAVERFRRAAPRGRSFPPFLFISPTNACNLRCRGCWVQQTRPPLHMPNAVLDRLIRAAKARGNRFFGILGGEPLLYPGLFAVLARHPDCYFQVFTNGTLVTDEIARTMRRLGNITPLVSVEGLVEESDRRRGGRGVFDRTLRGVRTLIRHRLVTGVASSICTANLDELATDAFVRRAVELGVGYLWYYIFRPVGHDPAPELALDEEGVRRLRGFLVEARDRYPLLVVDAYWDAEGRGLCPAAVGISHHVNPSGDIEPCPPIQLSRDNIGDGSATAAAFARSRFLAAFRSRVSARTQGCILLEDPGELRRLALDEGARDSSGRGTGLDDLVRMTRHCSHDLPEPIPERHPFYRFAKRHWFFGFGAYG